ncbi:MAG TPA: tetratricopeptide repeat protein, partial [Gemmatimonadaceae bacterium]|nr:tetratricopeptide repeat protein [Gemmatimonadaceae bacterium]
AYSLGVKSMQEKNAPRAIQLFGQALQLDPNMAPAMYQLSLAYAVMRDIDNARAVAVRLARIAPNFPGLAGWLATIGVAPQ